MSRLIDADELVAELTYLYEYAGWHEREIHFSLADMRCNVDIIPTVDAAKHGYWTNFTVSTEECSCCKHKYYISALFTVGGNDEPPYCPHCGAKMDLHEVKNG